MSAISMLPLLRLRLRKRTLEEAKKTNISLSRPFEAKEVRNKFWEDYKSMNFSDVVEKYMKPEKVRWEIKIRQHYKNTDNLNRMIGILMLPQRVVRKIFRILNIK